MNNAVQLIKLAQQLAIASGEIHIVVWTTSGELIVMREGNWQGVKLLERCFP